MTAEARPIANTRSTAGMPTGRLAVWWVIASEIVIFGGLIASYVMYRLAHDAWTAQAAHTNTWIGAFNTFVLLTSSLFAVLAHKAADAGDGKKAARMLVLTAAGGVLFLVVKSIEWTIEITHGYTLLSNTFWSFYYTAAGLHALHVLAGVIIMLFVAADAAKGRELPRVEYTGLYWHFVDIVWIFLFPLLYIAK
ncbi:MAG: cytochrome c oxidase subunit 3 [Gemmatimonadota bacterium]|jgi:heme/copper-type cytochrome/quinol oxidase subunit 3|nr:cytochrome c oxidase subunit 3 [Gemmatimonadota bacterium]MDP6529358.1 cytochrome c oxidase subunit 3 [Gemmatimonadota bacterium]MDP6803335.1 cytochrome c oxidase subunit 3 [Gemmatimonadota bacterium]MDP7031483.1 cytochrome c oxidase subunit 3 [Gemmatimonadota bacterium]